MARKRFSKGRGIFTRKAQTVSPPVWLDLGQLTWTTGDVISLSLPDYIGDTSPEGYTTYIVNTSVPSPNDVTELGLTVSSAGAISGTIDDLTGGTYNFIFDADNLKGTTVSSLTVTVVGLEITAPTFSSVPDQLLLEVGSFYSLDVTAYLTYDGDPANVQAITYAEKTAEDKLPPGTDISSVGVITGTVTGTLTEGTATIVATNESGLSVEIPILMSAVNNAVAAPTVIGMWGGPVSCGALAPVWDTVPALSFEDNEVTTYDLNNHVNQGSSAITTWADVGANLPSGITLGTTTGILTVDGTQLVASAVAITISAQNTTGTTNSSAFNLTVADLSNPQIISISAVDSSTALIVNFDESITTAGTYTDGFTFKINGSTVGLTIASGQDTNQLIFTSATTMTGNNTINLVYADSSGTLESVATANQVGDADETFVVPVASDWQLATGHYEAAQIPLEIVNPQAGLTTGTSAPSYYYRCYPGIKWRARISVLGGAFPHKYEIGSNGGATGLTIGETYGSADYGYLVLPDPQAGSYTITINVYDQENRVVPADTVSWTLTVTTNMAIFVDSTATDDTGTGAIDDRFKTMKGWYKEQSGAKDSAEHEHFHVYYYTGTYATDDDWDTDETGNSGLMKMRRKPVVHIGIDGQSVTFDFAEASFFFADGPANANQDVYFSNIINKGICTGLTEYWQRAYGFKTNSGTYPKRVVFSECPFGNQGGPGLPGQNSSWIFLGNGDGTYGKKYFSFHNNPISGIYKSMLIEAYDWEKIVIEGNTVQNDHANTVASRLVYFKVGSKNASVRNNTGITDTQVRIVDIGSSEGLYDEIEICWNNCKQRNSDFWHVRVGIEKTVVMGKIYNYRNTFTESYMYHEDTAGGGPVWYQNNVRQYVDGAKSQAGGATSVDGIVSVNVQFTVTGTSTDLIAASGLVDATTNELTGSNRTTYLGTKGHEVS